MCVFEFASPRNSTFRCLSMLSNPKFEVKTAKIIYLYLLIISSSVTSLKAYYLMINSAINETAYYKYHNRINKTENSVGSFYFP